MAPHFIYILIIILYDVKVEIVNQSNQGTETREPSPCLTVGAFVAKAIGEILKIGAILCFEDREDVIEEIASLYSFDLDNSIQNQIENSYEFMTVYTFFNDLCNALKPKPKYYHKLLDYGVNVNCFTTYIQLKDLSLHKITNIKEAVW